MQRAGTLRYVGPPRPGPLLNRPLGDKCSNPGKPSQANRGPKNRGRSGPDPTIPGDAASKWKRGQAEVKAAGDRLYLLFDWDNGARRGLIDAHREGTRLVGKYINLTDPKVTRPWIGLIVSNQRIDGRWTGGRLDFRR